MLFSQARTEARIFFMYYLTERFCIFDVLHRIPSYTRTYILITKIIVSKQWQFQSNTPLYSATKCYALRYFVTQCCAIYYVQHFLFCKDPKNCTFGTCSSPWLRIRAGTDGLRPRIFGARNRSSTLGIACSKF